MPIRTIKRARGVILLVGISIAVSAWAEWEIGSNEDEKIPPANPQVSNDPQGKNMVLGIEGPQFNRTQSNANELNVILEDVNGDGLVTVDDLKLIGQHVGEELEAKQPWDVNQDSKVDVFDLVSVARHIIANQVAAPPAAPPKIEELRDNRGIVRGYHQTYPDGSRELAPPMGG